jgi:amino acid permease
MKKISALVIIALLIGVAVYLYVFHKPHRDIQSEEAAFSIEATELMDQFLNNRSLADSLYVDQIVAVTGLLSSLEEHALTIAPGVYGSLDSTAIMPSLKIGDKVSIRGRVLSFDELFEEVKMDFVQVKD